MELEGRAEAEGLVAGGITRWRRRCPRRDEWLYVLTGAIDLTPGTTTARVRAGEAATRPRGLARTDRFAAPARPFAALVHCVQGVSRKCRLTSQSQYFSDPAVFPPEVVIALQDRGAADGKSPCRDHPD